MAKRVADFLSENNQHEEDTYREAFTLYKCRNEIVHGGSGNQSPVVQVTESSTGAHIYTSLPARLATRLSNLGGSGIKGFMVFGIAYAIAALSCTLPVFLAVVAGALTMRGFTSGLFQFISYALGMGFVITVVAIGSVLFKETVNRWLRRLVPVVARLSGLLLIFAGGYILYFWFVVGDILNWTF